MAEGVAASVLGCGPMSVLESDTDPASVGAGFAFVAGFCFVADVVALVEALFTCVGRFGRAVAAPVLPVVTVVPVASVFAVEGAGTWAAAFLAAGFLAVAAFVAGAAEPAGFEAAVVGPSAFAPVASTTAAFVTVAFADGVRVLEDLGVGLFARGACSTGDFVPSSALSALALLSGAFGVPVRLGAPGLLGVPVLVATPALLGAPLSAALLLAALLLAALLLAELLLGALLFAAPLLAVPFFDAPGFGSAVASFAAAGVRTVRALLDGASSVVSGRIAGVVDFLRLSAPASVSAALVLAASCA